MYRLTGSRRSYDWGSTTSMFDFLRLEADGEPFAELWLGANETGPSEALTPTGTEPLNKVIAAEPVRHLGERIQAGFGQLPYLLKLLAPARPLSLQVHPTPALARAGYKDEEARGVPLSDPARSFKDQHHKPEMVYALTRFEGLVGFRPHQEAAHLVKNIGGPLLPACEALASPASEGGMHHALELLLQLSPADVDFAIASCRETAAITEDKVLRTACETVAELAAFYPGDVGAVISLLLNRVVLQPGQLVFLAAGVPHAYLNGFGLELMANSDNVLRLGLTSKHIDVDAVFDAVDFGSAGFNLESASADAATHIFSPPVPEFALSISRPGRVGNIPLELPGDGPRILICVDGAIRVAVNAAAAEVQVLKRGESVYVPAADGRVTVEGSGTVAQAFVP